MKINELMENITQIEQKYLIFILPIILFIIKKYSKTNLISQILITCIALSIFDIYLKKIILINNTDEYYIFIINNIISVVIINFLIYLIDYSLDYNNFISLFYIAFACLFYELIVFKLYNHNNLCNQKLRNMTKTIIRLTTINIIYRFLQKEPYDKYWFDRSISQLCNILLFSIIFVN
jgi:hypothetical protein